MKDEKSENVLIHCPACECECLVLRKPRYDGFTKVGEDRMCTGCGHRLPDDTPAAESPKVPAVFDADDRTPVPELFRNDERGRLCRYCRHYTVNPFRQWCAEHRRDVEATESCDRFSARTDEPS